MCLVYRKSNWYWKLERWLNETVFKFITAPIARALGKPAPYVQVLQPLRDVRRWLLGGRKNHWCWNCAQVYYPGIFERLIEGAILMTGIPVLIAWWYSTYEQFLRRRMRSESDLGTLFNGPARVISVDGVVPLDPVYHGATRGEPLPEQFRERYARSGIPPVMIPARERIIPPTPMLLTDADEYARTGRNPFFNRLADALPAIVFEPVTGAEIIATDRYIVDKEIGEGTTQGHDEVQYTINILVGPNKVVCGKLYNRRTSTLCWYKTRASARRAKSRFMIRLGLTPVPMEDDVVSFVPSGAITVNYKESIT